MDAAPLTLAHTHARNAALEHKRNNPVAASEEYDLAAAEFAAAARDSTDLEARRLLSLMEAQHRKLGEILRTSHERSQEKRSVGETSRAATATDTLPARTPSAEPARPPSPENTVRPPRLPRGLRPNARDLSSSIASNLASARGIPSTRQKRPTPISPLVSAQNADGQIAQEDTTARAISRQNSSSTISDPASRPPWAPPVQPEPVATPKEQIDQHAADAPFQQFYSTFESLISKLSAPLAFAGLPLTSSPTPAPKATTNKPPAQVSPKTPSHYSAPAAPSIDYSQLISRAALRAVSGAPSINPSESFYVVPTTGGTISYAEIMNRAEREEGRVLRHHAHSRQTSNLSNISEDDFVDAQSTILPTTGPPSRFTRHRGAGGPSTDNTEAKVNGKTMEELALENQALKHLSDTLSKRLHVFEMSSQTASAAMAQSIRSLHVGRSSPLMSPENSRGRVTSGKGEAFAASAADDVLAKRIADLEDILRRSDARAKKKDEENAKLKETITKYREKWDSLKAGAKARRERERETRAATATATGRSDEKSQDAPSVEASSNVKGGEEG